MPRPTARADHPTSANAAAQALPAWKRWLVPLASLKLTVVLIVMAMILIYAGTWAQVDAGVWQVQKKYFHSLWTWISFQTFFPRPKAGEARIPGGFPMLGGYSVGLLLLINLLAAHTIRFKFTWKDLVLLPLFAMFLVPLILLDRGGIQWMSASLAWLGQQLSFIQVEGYGGAAVAAIVLGAVLALPFLGALGYLHRKRSGVILIHLGLILLLVGEGITSAMAVESQMTIDEGKSANFSQDIRHVELAIVDPSPKDHDDVAVIPGSQLFDGAVINHSALPVTVKIDDYFQNSAFLGPMQAGSRKDARATAGAGVGITVVNKSPSSGTDTDAPVDLPSAYVTLSRDGQSLGTYLVSANIDAPQQFTTPDGKNYTIQLRFKRLYKPYTMHLLDFRHDRYLGTDTPKDFTSLVRLVDPTRNVDREVRIWMNNPLRYHGETFYQAGFQPGDKTTILQVVRNPGWLMPYIACAIGALGMVIHFGMNLIVFARRRFSPRTKPHQAGFVPAGEPENPPVPWFGWPGVVSLAAVALVYVMTMVSILRPVGPKVDFDLRSFGQLPVTAEGRIQPLDSLARNSLKVINGKETATLADGTRISAVRWLADVFGHPDKADDYPVFRIDLPDILGVLGLDAGRKRFSFHEIQAAGSKFDEQFRRAQQVEPKERDLFQRKIIELGDKLMVYFNLRQMEGLFLVPPLQEGQKWQSFGDAVRAPAPPQAADAYLRLVKTYEANQPREFNTTLDTYSASVAEALPKADRKVRFEAMFNRLDPFTQCIALYLIAFVLACLSWLFWGTPLRRAAVVALGVALLIHTAGLIARVYISGRPPVTNLASSAIFIAWGAVVLSIGLELFFRNGVGSACAAIMGFSSLLIADRLALSGDTLKVLQAVLDTNFWLATHVIVITLGYSATFLAGFLGIVYVIGGLFTRSLTRTGGKELIRMIYGIVCFAMLFSFVGTILGGIWADQSWGRFWGWDPKENGAVLIVLANALLLHARWGGLVRDRGIACLAIFGNIVTSWSWFGTNMLGVGLHSYGFMDSALKVLLLFVLTQVLLIVAANLPLTWWRSYPRLFGAPTAEGRPRGAVPAV